MIASGGSRQMPHKVLAVHVTRKVTKFQWRKYFGKNNKSYIRGSSWLSGLGRNMTFSVRGFKLWSHETQDTWSIYLTESFDKI